MFSSPAYAQAAGGAAASGPSSLMFLVPWIAVFAIFYFLMIRPQQQRAKQQRAAIDAVKKGDTVVTAGGLLGKVTRVEDSEIEVEIAANTRVRVIKATLAEVRPLGSTKPAND